MSNVIQFPKRASQQERIAFEAIKQTQQIGRFITDLALVIQKFDGYATKLETQDLLHLLAYYDSHIDKIQARLDFIMERAAYALVKKQDTETH